MSQHFSDSDEFDDLIELLIYLFDPRTIRGWFCLAVVVSLIIYAII